MEEIIAVLNPLLNPIIHMKTAAIISAIPDALSTKYAEKNIRIEVITIDVILFLMPFLLVHNSAAYHNFINKKILFSAKVDFICLFYGKFVHKSIIQ
jgi:hypothetical protein